MSMGLGVRVAGVQVGPSAGACVQQDCPAWSRLARQAISWLRLRWRMVRRLLLARHGFCSKALPKSPAQMCCWAVGRAQWSDLAAGAGLRRSFVGGYLLPPVAHALHGRSLGSSRACEQA